MANLAQSPANARPAPATSRAAESGGVTDWQTPNLRRPRMKDHRWRAFMWSLVYPYRGNRLLLTLPGGIVIAVAMGIAAAAYNTSNNILFIALSLLLACLVFSGLLGWLNFKGVAWRLRVHPPLRAGRDHPVVIELNNRKQVLPTYGLWFELNVTGAKKTTQLPLRERLDARASAFIEWTIRPAARGPLTVEVLTAGSLFPFGFLKKLIGSELKREVLVWPASVQYQRYALMAWQQTGHAERAACAGQGSDLFSLRAYARGDSQRQVHWKASARLRRLMVRQNEAETQSGFSLWVGTSADEWPRSEQFELMCSLAATLAEDLFRAGRLASVSINDDAPLQVRRMHDLECFLDRLARVKPAAQPDQPSLNPRPVSRASTLTFAPDGARGVIAYINGAKAASA